MHLCHLLSINGVVFSSVNLDVFSSRYYYLAHQTLVNMLPVLIFVVSFLLPTVMALVGIDRVRPYKDDSSFFSCFPVSKVNSTKISISAKNITMNETGDPIPDIPFFLFTLIDFEKYDNMIANSFLVGHSNGRGRRGTNITDISVNEDFSNNQPVYVKGILDTSKWEEDHVVEKVIPMNDNPNPGFQCLYVTHPEDMKNIELEVQVINPNGHLPFGEYVKYEQNFYFTVTGFLILSAYFYSIYSHMKAGNGFSSISNLSRAFTFGIYLPLMLLSLVHLISDGLRNSKLPVPIKSEKRGSMRYRGGDTSPGSVLDLLEQIIHTCNYFVLLLVTMGYGSIYCLKTKRSNSNFRVIPSRLWNFALKLILINAFAIIIQFLDKKFSSNFFKLMDYLDGVIETRNDHINSYYFIFPVIKFTGSVFPLIWISVSSIYFFRTNSTLNRIRYPEGSLHGRIAKTFKYSILLIIALPVVFGSIYFILLVWQVRSTGKEFNKKEINSYDEYLGTIFTEALDEEKTYFHHTFQVQRIWVSNLYVLSSMLLTYFLWVKDNSGLIEDDASYIQIPMTSLDGKKDEEDENDNGYY